MATKKVLGVIPARLNSTRLPHKLLAEIEGRPLIWYTIHQAKKAKSLDGLVLATDSLKIRNAVKNAGIPVIMTASTHQCGSDRVAEVARKFKEFEPEVVINIQGDEPLLDPRAVDSVAKLLLKGKDTNMATAGIPMSDREVLSKSSAVKVILDKNNHAIYFSRHLIPFERNTHDNYLKHVGIFGFKKDFLLKYVKMKQTPLELAESLEQLRAIENGHKIKLAIGPFEEVSVDTHDDLEKVRAIIKTRIKDYEK